MALEFVETRRDRSLPALLPPRPADAKDKHAGADELFRRTGTEIAVRGEEARNGRESVSGDQAQDGLRIHGISFKLRCWRS